EPNEIRLLRSLQQFNQSQTQIPTSVPADGSVTDSKISGDGIDVNHLYGSITSSGDVTISAAVVAGEFNAAGGVTVNANTLQGVITGSSVQVSTSTFQGV